MSEKDRRLELHQKLVDVMDGNPVYFQPPENFKMTYPCIVYSRKPPKTMHADDFPYIRRMRYQITVIDKDPDSPYPERVWGIKGMSRVNFFVHDNLNHDIFEIYY